MSGALPQQPEEFLDHVRNVPHDYVPSVDDEVDEFLMLREVRWIFSIEFSLYEERGISQLSEQQQGAFILCTTPN